MQRQLFVYVFSVVFTCCFEGYLLYFVSAIIELQFLHVPLLCCPFVGEMLATLVAVGQALLVPVALHGLAEVYLKR